MALPTIINPERQTTSTVIIVRTSQRRSAGIAAAALLTVKMPTRNTFTVVPRTHSRRRVHAATGTAMTRIIITAM
jgi:hypothetical protein